MTSISLAIAPYIANTHALSKVYRSASTLSEKKSELYHDAANAVIDHELMFFLDLLEGMHGHKKDFEDFHEGDGTSLPSTNICKKAEGLLTAYNAVNDLSDEAVHASSNVPYGIRTITEYTEVAAALSAFLDAHSFSHSQRRELTMEIRLTENSIAKATAALPELRLLEKEKKAVFEKANAEMRARKAELLAGVNSRDAVAEHLRVLDALTAKKERAFKLNFNSAGRLIAAASAKKINEAILKGLKSTEDFGKSPEHKLRKTSASEDD